MNEKYVSIMRIYKKNLKKEIGIVFECKFLRF